MKTALQELQKIVTLYASRFDALSEDDLALKPAPTKWSKKEILGHLIDSAQNNLRRFIAGQYEDVPRIVYDQNFWVTANSYQQYSKSDVINLWRLVNQQILHVLADMPVENYGRECKTSEALTLEWLASDYVKHLKHHINQIIPGSFDVRYP